MLSYLLYRVEQLAVLIRIPSAIEEKSFDFTKVEQQHLFVGKRAAPTRSRLPALCDV
jgi:hypothetical protein